MPTHAVLRDLLAQIGLPVEFAEALSLLGGDVVLASSFQVDRAAAASIAASALAASHLHALRGGQKQRVTVDFRHAAAAFRSEHYVKLNGEWIPAEWGGIAGLYPTRGGGWVRVHANFPHHAAGTLRLLNCAADRAAVAAAIVQWDAVELETAAADAGLVIVAKRSFAAWDATPQGQAVPNLPLVQIERLGDAPPAAWREGETPLDGLRVLDLTWVIAGPVGTRTLAAHGADVLSITGPGLSSYCIEDLGRGKRQAQLDLTVPEGRVRLAELVSGADVFVQGYRPGSIAGRGFSPERLAALRPGIVSASLSAYGDAGPWAGRRGFDSLVQTAKRLQSGGGRGVR